ncbi:SdpI family protein [Sedimentibacter sp.]|uniref:SdpI family protein n=1 Tax=Sedimentibacter sp. TaxID=1960295 RepID=UPI0028A9539B|nr:SdpI family protein [Sedimentibacter sp.]
MNKIFNQDNFKLWIVFVVSLLIAIISYGYLPDMIPIHFDVAGNVDNYASRISIFLTPAINLMMIILAEVVKNIDPKKSAYKKFNKQYYLTFFLVSLLMLVIELYTIAFSLNMKIFNINAIMPLGVGLLFTVIGNMMPKFKQNFYAGIRTSWTISDSDVWYKTHRLGGKLWFIGGILMMVSAILPAQLKAVLFFTVVAVLVIVPLVYSYVIYKNKHK